ncbi:MAG: DUF4062 domain-containing protein [Devosia sp.]
MSYEATALKIMIASPSDVAAERQIVRDVVHEWNAINSEERRYVLLPVGWETHASPAMGAHPQQIINKQVLSGCDVLIAVFWTKLGTPTPNYQSGTAEEINEHLAAGKPALLYFSSEPVALGSFDSDEYDRLKTFESDLRARGLLEYYDTKGEFREKLARQLSQTLIRNFTHATDITEARVLPEIFGASEPLQLSQAAQELLGEAVKDKNGIVTRIQYIGGEQVRANGRQFIDSPDPRTAAKWRSAVDELWRKDLIEDRGGKGEVFFVTGNGYDLADQIFVH